MRIVHIGLFFRRGNAGDIVIRSAVKTFLGRHEYVEYNTRTEVTSAALADINASDGVVVGGGGLFWNNPRLDYRSGWQWNITPEVYEAIRVPICLYAVGDSSFSGETIDSPQFRDFFARSPSRPIIGLRNRGSIRSVDPVIGEHATLFYQPCPTSFLRHYDSGETPPRGAGPPIVSVNVPMDRVELRYGSDATLRTLARAITTATRGVALKVACHIEGDLDFLPFMDAAGARYEVVPLQGKTPAAIIDYYRNVDLSVGGRAHAVLIPLGLGKPVVGVASHDKIRWAFADLEEPMPCVDVALADDGHELSSAIGRVVDDLDGYAQRASANSRRLYDLSLRNRDLIVNEFFRGGDAKALDGLATFSDPLAL